MSAWDELAAEAPSVEDQERRRTVSASQGLVGRLEKVQPEPPAWTELTRDAPATQELLADPVRAAPVADDVEGLSAVEKVFRGSRDMLTGGIGEALYRGGLNDRLAQIGYRQSQGWATPDELAEAERLEVLVSTMARPQVGLVARGLRAAAESLPMMLGSLAEAQDEVAVGSAAAIPAARSPARRRAASARSRAPRWATSAAPASARRSA